MAFLRRILAGVLTLSMLSFPVCAADCADARRVELDRVVSMLSENHPDLYAHVSREAFAAKRASIAQNAASWDDFGFALEVQSLTAMVGDAHTALSLPVDGAGTLPFTIAWMNGAWVVTAVAAPQRVCLGWRVEGIAGRPIAAVERALDPYLSYDNDTRRRRMFASAVTLRGALVHAGVLSESAETVALHVVSPDGLHRDATLPVHADGMCTLSALRRAVPVTEYDPNVIYKALDLVPYTLYIQYNACKEDENYPMAAFAAQVRDTLTHGSYARVIVDLRANGGGSDGVLRPVLHELIAAQQRGIKVNALVGEGTFSAAVTGAVQLAQLGAVTVGTPTGGSVDHFGSVVREVLSDGSRLSCSTQWVALSSYYQAARAFGADSLTPAQSAPQPVDDYLAGGDRPVACVLAQPDHLPARTAAATATGAIFTVDGSKSALTGVRIGGAVYLRLRDLAAALRGTRAAFDVAWSERDGAVYVFDGQPYLPVGGELTPVTGGTAYAADTPILRGDTQPLAYAGAPGALRVYDLRGSHFVRLTDLAAKLRFSVAASGSAVRITTK